MSLKRFLLQCAEVNGKVLAASWSELKRVNIFDLCEQLEAVDNEVLHSKYNKDNRGNNAKPIFTFNGHRDEGFAIDWCPTSKGVSIEK